MTSPALAPQEQPCRTQPGFKHSPMRVYAWWKGKSARKYQFEIRDLAASELADIGPCVALAVAPDRDGVVQSQPPMVFEASATAAQRRAWVERSRRDGATELRTYRLASSVAERAAVAEDLRP